MKIIIASLIITSLIFCHGLFAQPGTLDSTFGTDGIVTASFCGSESISSVNIQPDGKIVVAGNTSYFLWDEDSLVVARYNVDGTPDSSFNSDGISVFEFLPGQNVSGGVSASLIQPNGRILVAGSCGSTTGPVSHGCLSRLHSNGTLDSSFGTNGTFIEQQIQNSGFVSVNLQSNGRIIAAGYVYPDSSSIPKHIMLTRCMQDGSVDSSFNHGNVALFKFPDRTCYPSSSVVQSDGKIIVAGRINDSVTSLNYDFALVRFNPDGSPDSSFGIHGLVTTDIGFDFDAIHSIKIQNNGKIVVAGHTWTGIYPGVDVALARYNPDGTPDSSFGNGGIVTTNVLNNADWANAIVQQPDGKLVIGGFSGINPHEKFLLVRYLSDGNLDQNFGSNGIVTTSIFSEGNYVNDLALQSDGKIVAAGQSYYDFALVRYLSDFNVGIIEHPGEMPPAYVFPNPVRDEARLKYSLAGDETVSIFLYNTQGQCIQSIIENVKQSKGTHLQTIRFPTDLPAGLYLLVVSTSKHCISTKIIK